MVRILYFKNFLLIGTELANFVTMFRHLAPSFWIPAAVLSLALAMMYVVWPSAADEVWYMMDLRHYTNLAGGSVAAGIFDSMVYHSAIDNIRLCNILYMSSLALPEWVDWPLLWGAYFVWIVATARLAGISLCRWPAALVVFAAVAWLPVADPLMVDECYQYNYTMSVAVSLEMAWVFLNPGHRPIWLMALCGLVAGWWHEGFGLPMASATVGMVLFMPGKFRDIRHIAFAVGAVVGVLIIVFTPGTWVRSTAIGGQSLTVAQNLTRHWPALLALASVALTALVPRLRGAFAWPLLLFLTISIAASLALNVVIRYPRVGYWAIPGATVILLYQIRKAYAYILGSVGRPGPIVIAARLTVVAVGMLAAAWVGVGVAAALYFRPRVQALYASGADLPIFSVSKDLMSVPVFGPVCEPFDRPALNIAWSYYRELVHTNWCCGMVCEYHHGVRAIYVFFPSELERVTPDAGTAAASNGAVRRIGNHFFFAAEDFPQAAGCVGVEAECRLGPVTRRFPVDINSFRSKADGRTYYYMRFKQAGRLPMLWPVADLKIVDWYEKKD